jgi:hypothetical protein
VNLLKLIFIIILIVVAGTIFAPRYNNSQYEMLVKDYEIDQLKRANEFQNKKHLLFESLVVLGISDKGLIQCIKNEMENYSHSQKFINGEIVPDVTLMKKLWCFRQKIQSIKGIEKFNNLTSLNLSYNSIKDLTPILKLEKLKFLSLNNNKEIDRNTLLKLDSSITVELPDFYQLNCQTLRRFINNAKFQKTGPYLKKFKSCMFEYNRDYKKG